MSFAAILFLLGRLIFGGYFIMNAITHFRHNAMLTGYAKSKGVPMASFGVFLTGVLLLLGGLGVVAGFFMIPGMWLLVAFLLPTTLYMHAYWKIQDQTARMNERISFMKNIALIGALLMMIAMAYMGF